MPAFTLDIKAPNTLEKMANKTAKALEAVAVKEAKINALLAKGMKTGKVSGELAKKTSQQMLRIKKQIIEQSAKEIATGRQQDNAGKKQLSFTEKLSKNYLMVRDAVMIAFRAAKAMTVDAIDKGNEFAKLAKSMQFEVDLFASGTETGKQFKEIEKFAHGNITLAKEMTDQWVKFRKASTGLNVVTNEQAAGLLRVWADIRAISQSSEQATKVTDEWISKFAEGPDVAARFLQQVKGAHKGWEKIGTGELFKNMKGPLALEDKMDAASQKMVSALAPLTKLMNDLKSQFADFLMKLASNKVFKNFIADLVEGTKWLINKGLPALTDAFTKFWNFFSDLGDKLAKSDFAGKLFDYAYAAQKWLEKQMEPEKVKAPPPSMTAPPPTPPAPRAPAEQKGAMNAPKVERQLAGITIQNLNVNGGGDPQENARSVRQELQLLLQAGALSKGLA